MPRNDRVSVEYSRAFQVSLKRSFIKTGLIAFVAAHCQSSDPLLNLVVEVLLMRLVNHCDDEPFKNIRLSLVID